MGLAGFILVRPCEEPVGFNDASVCGAGYDLQISEVVAQRSKSLENSPCRSRGFIE